MAEEQEVKGMKLTNSLHTAGFYTRISDLEKSCLHNIDNLN